jgi:hypothetical protein
VDDSGYVTGMKRGKTNVNIQVDYKGKTARASCEIIVDDAIEGLNPAVEQTVLLGGMKTLIKPNIKTIFGKTVYADKVSYSSGNTNVISVDERGLVTALNDGVGTVAVKAQKNGEIYDESIVFKVMSAPSGDLIEDSLFWFVSGDGEMKADAGSLKLTCLSGKGYASYPVEKYTNQTFQYNMTVEAEDNDWPSIMLRNQDYSLRVNDAGNSGYIITIKPEVIEVQRFNNGQRSVFYGDVSGFAPKISAVLKNDYITYGKTVNAEFGTQNVDGGVRIFLTVDGQKVFDIVDTDENRIGNEGYFGILVNTGSIKLSKN